MPSSSEFDRRVSQLASNFDGEFLVDQTTRRAYATDASLYEELPRAVALPKTESDIRNLIEFARTCRIGLIPRTAGTSLAGQVVGNGVVVDLSRHFTRIIEINAEERWVRVQPGVIRNELNMDLAPLGLLFGPETSTANRAMIGGMLGNNSCGSNSIVYGSTRDHVLEVTGFLSDGSKVTFGDEDINQVSELELDSTSAATSRLAAIRTEMHKLLSDGQNQERIRKNFPKRTVTRRNTGYALDALLDCRPYSPDGPNLNFCRLIAGSEGTLLLATEIKLRCHPLPPKCSGLLCIHFTSIDQALRATQIAMRFRPYACELIDRIVLESAARNLEQRENLSFVEGEPAAILVVELRGADEAEVRAASEQVERAVVDAGFGYSFPLLFGSEGAKVWELRRAGLGVLSNVPGDAKPVTVIEDTAVALEDLPEYIAEFNVTLREKFGFECVHYAHAGAGELHLRPVINLKTEEGRKQFRDVATVIAELVRKWNGALSGEHGDGRLRGEFLPLVLGEDVYQLCKQVKSIWDPEGIFNPGKIVDAPPMDQDLRFSVKATHDVPTIFDFSDSLGMLGAAEMCSGSGDCRKTHRSGGTMCPSYMATRDERDTTRARANLLRQAMTQPRDSTWPLDDENLREVLDLCLSCKGCKRECPSNVDLAKLKAEFTQADYDRHGTPLRARMIANFAAMARFASLAPNLYNGMMSHRWIGSWFRRWCGFHPQRSIPTLAPMTLSRWFKRRKPTERTQWKGSVYFFFDEFTNFLDVRAGIAAIELLERLGYRVLQCDHKESGRAAISKGMLRKARALAEKNTRLLSPIVDSETPLIGIEPSALLTFRDEYPLLLRGALAEQARQIGSNCMLIDEFIAREFRCRRVQSDAFSDQTQKILLHGHCHQKALASVADSVQMLQIPKNFRVQVVPSGCCGMAGSFGYEREHFQLSNQIGELVLFPAVRSASDDVVIAAPGTSCRHQILDGTKKVALHPAEILRNALLPSESGKGLNVNPRSQNNR